MTAKQQRTEQLKDPQNAKDYLEKWSKATDDEHLLALRDVSDALTYRSCGARLHVEADGSYAGQLTGIPDLVEFKIASTDHIWEAFRAAVDAYLGPDEPES